MTCSPDCEEAPVLRDITDSLPPALSLLFDAVLSRRGNRSDRIDLFDEAWDDDMPDEIENPFARAYSTPERRGEVEPANPPTRG